MAGPAGARPPIAGGGSDLRSWTSQYKADKDTDQMDSGDLEASGAPGETHCGERPAHISDLIGTLSLGGDRGGRRGARATGGRGASPPLEATDGTVAALGRDPSSTPETVTAPIPSPVSTPEMEAASSPSAVPTPPPCAAAARAPSLTALAALAASQAKAGETSAALATYRSLFMQARRSNSTHRDLHVARANAAGAALKLGLMQEALELAEQALRDADGAAGRGQAQAARRTRQRAGVARGDALVGLGRAREATTWLERAAGEDPLDVGLGLALQRARARLVEEVGRGNELEHRLLTYPAPEGRIGFHEPGAPAHRLRPDDELPARLLTGTAAERGGSTRDTYTFFEVRSDVRAPAREIEVATDAARGAAVRRAIEAAVAATEAEDKDARVLDLSCGCGLGAVMSLRAGARHVAASDRALYLASATKEVLDANWGTPRPGAREEDDDEGVIGGTGEGEEAGANGTEGVEEVGAGEGSCGSRGERGGVGDGKAGDEGGAGGPSSSGLGAGDPSGGVLAGPASLSTPYSVLHGRPTDVRLGGTHLPVPANVLLLDGLLDEGLLTGGIALAARHAWESGLVLPDARVIPASATVYAQAVELRTPRVCGLNLDALNARRWCPTHLDAPPYGPPPEDGDAGRADGGAAAPTRSPCIPLSEPVPAFYFTFSSPPTSGETKTLDITMTREGRWNAVLFWYELDLGEGEDGDRITLSSRSDWCAAATGAAAGAATCLTLRPGVQYLAGELGVSEGEVWPLRASHNTARARFDVEEASYLRLAIRDGSFPRRHFNMAADAGKYEAYRRAMARAAGRLRERRGGATGLHALDVGTGTGILAMLAARSGFESVLAPEAHPEVARVAREAVATNGLAGRVAVLHADATELRRGQGARVLGYDLIVSDLFDAALLGDNARGVLSAVAAHLAAPDAVYVPAAATLWCVGVDASVTRRRGALETERETPSRPATGADGADGSATGAGRDPARSDRAEALDLSPLETYLWDASYAQVDARKLPYRVLTEPAKVTDVDLGARGLLGTGGARPAAPRDALVKLKPVSSGELNAILFWFDLHLDDHESLTNAPPGFGLGGTVIRGQERTAPPPATDATATVRETTVEETTAAGSTATAAAVAATVPVAAATAATAASTPMPGLAAFEAAASFAGARSGAFFGLGDLGLGYYRDEPPRMEETAEGAEDEPRPRDARDAPFPPGEPDSGDDAEAPHYWGQALQYLDSRVGVTPGRTVTLLAKRAGPGYRFALRAGVGEPAPRAPWKETWGGGSSIENPHVQRLQYTDLLITEFLQRVPSGRFPPISKDTRPMLHHSGSLFLPVRAAREIAHELECLEELHRRKDGCAGVTLEGVTRECLETR